MRYWGRYWRWWDTDTPFLVFINKELRDDVRYWMPMKNQGLGHVSKGMENLQDLIPKLYFEITSCNETWIVAEGFSFFFSFFFLTMVHWCHWVAQSSLATVSTHCMCDRNTTFQFLWFLGYGHEKENMPRSLLSESELAAHSWVFQKGQKNLCCLVICFTIREKIPYQHPFLTLNHPTIIFYEGGTTVIQANCVDFSIYLHMMN